MGSIKLFTLGFCYLLLLEPYTIHAALRYTLGGLQAGTAWTAGTAVCNTAMTQSPIDIPLTAQYARYGPLKFNSFKDVFPGTVENTLYTLLIRINHGGAITITNGGLPNTFIFDQINFHWPSEHTIEGVNYPLEAQLIFYNSKYNDLAAASAQQDGVAILSVLYHVSEHDNLPLNLIINSARTAFTPPAPTTPPAPPAPIVATAPEALVNGLRLSDLLPDSHCSFFRYRGSFTSPNCQEVVYWTVFLDTLPISEAQLTKLRTLPSDAVQGGNNLLVINSRPTRPRNGRLISFQSSFHCRVGSSANHNTIPWMLRPFFLLSRI